MHRTILLVAKNEFWMLVDAKSRKRWNRMSDKNICSGTQHPYWDSKLDQTKNHVDYLV